VKVNCSAISAGLVESELFGHVRGAFTGAIERRIGRFELANAGTIFLDEVGDLPLDAQVKLLRVLQEQEFEPVGSNRTVSVDVRVIAATNRDLAEAVRAGRFRSDLFYRLNVVPIEVPPLRARLYDIAELVTYFLERFSRKFGKKIGAVSEETMECLLRYSWPGNVRELQNVIERSVVLARGPVLEIDPRVLTVNGAPLRRTEPREAEHVGDGTLRNVERDHITVVLKRTGWVIDGPRGAAKILGLHPNTLRSRMEKLGVKRPSHEMS
jgi:formate hydrogenlyase transcriptional activator